ncbi:MAG TPA: methylmalonyl-CoA mutase family protein [Dehalococcoidia bacterium]|nr:methylmalonyl-CoA mutase family protein [Dehalococcoidia bacterium]
MYDAESLERISRRRAEWEKGTDEERPGPFMTTSGRPIHRVYDPTDLPDQDYERDLGLPGEYPFTRGIHATGYRGKPWTMRMFAGFGSAEETNARFRYLLSEGQMGLSIAFDLPTLMGYDTDAPEALGEYGKCGVAVSSLADMEVLLDGLPLGEITTSMTINSPAAAIWAMYIVAAEKRGVPRRALAGTLQNDILKEFIAQKEYIFPPEPSMRLVVDTIEFGTREMPQWNTISISGYHIREAGSTAVQELAFTLADGFEYVRWCLERGLEIDEFAPRLSFFFNCHNDFFEEVAKFRAARKIWARELKERFGAQSARSWWMRFHTQTAGVSLAAQQPEVNLIRTAIQALAAVMGGTQSLHTNSMDEALALPSEKAARLALRTQQVIAHESGAANTVDPLAGSFFVEALTRETEEEAYGYFHRIEDAGGVLPAIEAGFFQREIAEASYRYQQEIDSGQRVIVGVNEYVQADPIEIPILQIDPEGEKRQRERLKRVRRERDGREVVRCLRALEQACRGQENVMPYLLEAVTAYCTLSEICEVMRGVFGAYHEESVV